MVIIQENKGGYFSVQIPVDTAKHLNLKKGDAVIFLSDAYGTHAIMKKTGSKEDHKGREATPERKE